MSSKTIIKGLLLTLKIRKGIEDPLVDSLEHYFNERELEHEEEIKVLNEKITDMRAVNECLDQLLDEKNDRLEIDGNINMKL